MRVTPEKIGLVILAALLFVAAYSLMQAGEAEPDGNETVFYSGAFALRIFDANSTPVQGALVNYSIGGEKGGGYSGSDGVLGLYLKESGLLSISVRKDGFETEALTIIPTRGEATVTLETKKSSSVEYSGASEATAAFTVKGPEGEPTDGKAHLLDFESSLELGSCELEGGACVINGLRKGAIAFAVAEAEGYALFDGSGKPEELGAYTAFDLELILESSGAVSEMRCLGQSAEPLDCNLTVYSPPDYALSAIESNGTAYFAGEEEGEYYFVAERGGHYLSSPLFKAGGSAQVAFVQEGIELKVVTIDESGEPLQSLVKVNGADNRAAAAAVNSSGEALFELPTGEYKVTAVNEESRKAVELSLNSDAFLSFKFESRPAFVSLNAFDFANKSVNALFTVRQDNAIVCGGSKGSFEVRAGAESIVTAEAAGYLRVEETVSALNENEVKSVSFAMQKSAAGSHTAITLLGAFDEEGELVEELEAGREYSIKLRLEPSNNEGEAGVFLRVEGEAVITKYPSGDEVAKSSFYGDEKDYCGGLLQDNAIFINNGFKWVDSSSKSSIRTVEFKVRVDEEGPVGLYYRGYSIVNEEWDRDPFDPELGLKANNGKAGCYANAHYAEYKAVEPAGEAAPEPTLPEGNASFWIEGGELKSAVEKISFQADAVFPADAVPFSLDAECELAYSIESSGGTEYCYGISAGYAWFKSGDYNPACSIKVNGNELQPDDSASIVVTGACVKDSRVEIPIELQVRAEESFRAVPKQGKGEGTVALYYLAESKQVGSRFLSFDGKEYSFGGPGVKAIEWNGQGESAVMEDGFEAVELQYAAEEGFFDNRFSLGGRVESCLSAECCSNNWCTPSALEEMVEAFKSEAAGLAERTLFKRGPLPVLEAGGFDYASAAQLTQGGFAALEEAGFQVEASDCDYEEPAIFELKASSPDGTAWSYSARVLKLDGEQLCGFMHAEEDGIVKTKFASMESIQMISEENSQAIPVPSFYSDVKGAKAACLAAPVECALQSGELYSIPAIVPSLQTSAVICTGISGVCAYSCAPKEARVELVTHDNKLYAIMRFGVNALCAPTAPALQSLLSNAGVSDASEYLKQELGGLTAEFESQARSPLDYDLSDLEVVGG